MVNPRIEEGTERFSNTAVQADFRVFAFVSTTKEECLEFFSVWKVCLR